MDEIYIDSMRNLLAYYKDLGENAIEQLGDGQIDWNQKDKSNNVSIIVKHLVGNMLLWWTGFLAAEGEVEWTREQNKIIADVDNGEDMLKYWTKGWDSLFISMDALKPEDLEKEILIGNEEFTIVEAINRQLGHYAYHVGQIVHIAKEVRGSDWTSVSAVRDESMS